MDIANIGFNAPSSRLDSFVDRADFMENLLSQIKTLNPNFPYAPIYMSNRSYRGSFNNFISNFFSYVSGYNEDLEYTDEERNYLYTHFVIDMLNNAGIKKTVNEQCDVGGFLRSCMNVTPIDELDLVFSQLIREFGERQVLDSIETLVGNNEHFYVTQKITDAMIEHGCSWQTIAIPQDKFYDLDYIREIVNRVGRNGLMFGTGYSQNRYFINRLDLTKMPAEFFVEFGEYLCWQNISCCDHSSLSFMKEHKEDMVFYYVPKKIAALIDDELGEYLIENSTNADYNVQALTRSISLSIEFTIKHIVVLSHRKNNRLVVAGPIEHKLAELVSAMD